MQQPSWVGESQEPRLELNMLACIATMLLKLIFLPCACISVCVHLICYIHITHSQCNQAHNS